jgi:intracellular septation protein
MKQLLDFIPLLVFFVAYKWVDIFFATLVLIIATSIQYGFLYIKNRQLEKSQVITLVGVLIFGGLTLAFHNVTYLKWKAPIINWIFAVIFLGSQYIGKQPLIQRLLGKAIELPAPVWRRLNISWVIFFIIAGGANLYVAFTYDAIWVDFKVFGSLAMTLVFMVGQGLYLAKYIKTTHDKESNS